MKKVSWSKIELVGNSDRFVWKEIEKAFEMINRNPEYSAQQIAQELGKTPRAIEKYLAKLKDAGIIKRKGPKLGGYWEII